MTMVTLSKLFAPTAVPRKELPKYAVQIVFKSDKMVWVTKSFYIRNPPYTIWNPTARQAAWRLAFGMAAAKWRGVKGKAPLKFDSRKHKAGDIVLAVQAKAQEVLKSLYEKVASSLPAKKEKKHGMSEATKKKLEAAIGNTSVINAIEAAIA